MFKLLRFSVCLFIISACTPDDTKKAPNEIIRDIANGDQDIPLPSPEPQPDEPDPVLPHCKEYCDTSEMLLKETDRFGFMSFVNFGYRGIGRCRGHAIVTQNLSQLAFFDKNDTSCVDSDYDSECASQALIKIKNVLNYQAQKINGFPDLLSLSTHPKLKGYLMMRVRSISHKYSARPVEIENPRSDNMFENIFYEIQERIELKHEPYIGIKGFNIGDHALLAYDFKNTVYGPSICVRDSNYIPTQGLACSSILFISEGKIFYKRADLEPTQLFIFNLMTDEDARVVKYQSAQKAYCLNSAPRQGLCTL